jgi:hypothetical protein
MYEILFHVASIALLEISFFFYYIGPKETDMFLHYIERILKNPLIINSLIENPLIENPLIENPLIENPLIELRSLRSNVTFDFQEQLYEKKNDGTIERMQHNEELFIQSIEYWLLFTIFSVCVFGCHYAYTNYVITKDKRRGLVSVLSDIESNVIESNVIEENVIDANEIEMITYRKTSMDSEDNESQIHETPNPSGRSGLRITKLCKIAGHYFVFCGCIITFQYLFFKYIAFAYKPLSISEIEYFLYTYITEATGLELDL